MCQPVFHHQTKPVLHPEFSVYLCALASKCIQNGSRSVEEEMYAPSAYSVSAYVGSHKNLLCKLLPHLKLGCIILYDAVTSNYG